MISIIIPTLNEEETIGYTLNSLVGCLECEIIVVDGGSVDKTVQIAQSFHIKTCLSPPSRALQMNRGALEAKGNILLFLHADTLIPKDFEKHIYKVLHGNDVIAGAFELGIDYPKKRARIVEKVANWRSRFLQFPFGDQAIFIKKKNFLKYEGFDEVDFLEDLKFISRLRNHGKIGIAQAKVVTSGRRWKKLGVFKTTLLNQIILAGYLLGFSIPRLKKLYGVIQKR